MTLDLQKTRKKKLSYVAKNFVNCMDRVQEQSTFTNLQEVVTCRKHFELQTYKASELSFLKLMNFPKLLREPSRSFGNVLFAIYCSFVQALYPQVSLMCYFQHVWPNKNLNLYMKASMFMMFLAYTYLDESSCG